MNLSNFSEQEKTTINELLKEIEFHRKDWLWIYQQPNYAPNLALAVEAAEIIKKLLAENESLREASLSGTTQSASEITEEMVIQHALDIQAKNLDLLGRHEEAELVRRRVPNIVRPQDK